MTRATKWELDGPHQVSAGSWSLTTVDDGTDTTHEGSVQTPFGLVYVYSLQDRVDGRRVISGVTALRYVFMGQVWTSRAQRGFSKRYLVTAARRFAMGIHEGRTE